MGALRIFRKNTFKLVLVATLPFVELYTYLVFCGIFVFWQTFVSTTLLIILFLIYNYLFLYKIVVYLEILQIEDKSTVDLFPKITERDVTDKCHNINPYAITAMMNQSMDRIQLCDVCQTYKPPRTHHCSAKNLCYLKYDHFCVFFNCAIGFHNYKTFIQFLVACFISNILFLVLVGLDTGLPPFPNIFTFVNYLISLGLVLVEAIFIGILLAFHIQLISRNETSIEYQAIESYIRGDISYTHVFQKGAMKTFSQTTNREKLNPYNIGTKNNWLEVFGDKPFDWLRTNLSSKGNGLFFPLNNYAKEDEDSDLEMI